MNGKTQPLYTPGFRQQIVELYTSVHEPRGDAYDNAMAESFFASLECELLKRTVLPTKSAARTALFRYIEGWYNSRRRHGSIGMMAPNAFEAKATKNRNATLTKTTATLTGYPPGQAVASPALDVMVSL